MGANFGRRDGTVATWNDDRGFGFIQPAPQGERVFAHIWAFPSRSVRPEIVEPLTFVTYRGEDGRHQAHGIKYLSYREAPAQTANRAHIRPEANTCSASRRRAGGRSGARPGLAASIAMLALFAALCVFVNASWPLPLWVLGVYAGASAVTFIAYAMDKSAAKAGRWRTSENTLLLLGLLGGWPGALIAQQLLRHKTQKQSFRQLFWVTAWTNLLVFVVVTTPLLPDALAQVGSH